MPKTELVCPNPVRQTCKRLLSLCREEELWEFWFKRDLAAAKKQGLPYEPKAETWRERYCKMQQLVDVAVKSKAKVRHEFEEDPLLAPPRPNPYAPSNPYAPPNPFAPPNPRPGFPFNDPDSPYFGGEIPPAPGILPPGIHDPFGDPFGDPHGIPDPQFGLLGPRRPTLPGMPRNPPLGQPYPRNPRGPRFDYFGGGGGGGFGGGFM